MLERVVWRPQPGPQHDLVRCPHPEVFFGGARGGGKTDGMLGKWAKKEAIYGPGFNAVMFRRTTVSSTDAIDRSKQIYGPLGGGYNESKLIWRMPNGGRVAFAYLDSTADADEYQGRNLTDAWIEEAGQYPSPAPIFRLFGAMRSAGGVPVQMVLTGNPGGPGQSWIRERYEMVPFPTQTRILRRQLPDGTAHKVAVIPSRLIDNRILLRADPRYASRLYMVGNQALVRAWLNGDWNAVEGAFFDEWDEARHVVAPFAVPSDWLRFRSMDWGSASPFSVGWWAVAGDDYVIERGAGLVLPGGGDDGDLRRRLIPRGALVRYREWYGSPPDDLSKGLKLSADEVGQGITKREKGDRIAYGVLDPSAFAENGGLSIAEMLRRSSKDEKGIWMGPRFRPADNTRVSQRGAMSGWMAVHSRLKGNGEHPMLFVFSTCSALIKTLPTLQHDQDRPEDLDTTMIDHAADETRYACMSRPYVATRPEAPKPANPTGYSGVKKPRVVSALDL